MHIQNIPEFMVHILKIDTGHHQLSKTGSFHLMRSRLFFYRDIWRILLLALSKVLQMWKKYLASLKVYAILFTKSVNHASLLVDAIFNSYCTLLVCGGAWSTKNGLLRVGNFQGLSALTVDVPFDGIFPVRGWLFAVLIGK